METPRPEPQVDSSYPPGHPDHYVHDPEIALSLAEYYNGGPLGTDTTIPEGEALEDIEDK